MSKKPKVDKTRFRRGGPEQLVSRMENTNIRIRDERRFFPAQVIVEVRINGQRCRAMIDTGSQADMIFTTLADQLKIELEQLKTPLEQSV